MCNEINTLDAEDRERLERFQLANRISIEQSRLGLSKPLDLAALLERVEQRVAAESKT